VNKLPGRSPGGANSATAGERPVPLHSYLKIELIWLTKSKPAWLDVHLNRLVAADALKFMIAAGTYPACISRQANSNDARFGSMN
jgi:hypothetical protein